MVGPGFFPLTRFGLRRFLRGELAGAGIGLGLGFVDEVCVTG